jgi:hypothetical protein
MKAFACICSSEQLGIDGTSASACGEMLGAPDTLSGKVVACFGKNSPATPACLVAVHVGCNDVQLTDPIIPETGVAEALPVPSGGTIADGTYVLTEWLRFTGPGGGAGPLSDLWRKSLSIQGGTMQEVSMKFENSMSSPTPGVRATWTLAVAGTSLTTTPTCRNGTPSSNIPGTVYGFDAASTKLTLYRGQERQTFVKQ